MRRFFAFVLATLLVVVFSACDRVMPETVDRTDSFTVPPTYRLEIETFNGNVDIAVAEGESLEVTATIDQPDDVEYSAVLEGETVRISGRALRTRTNPSPGVSLTITAPPGAVLDISSTNGNVTSAGVGTGGMLETSNGTIRLEQVEGEYRLDSSNGAIELDRVAGVFQASTSNGRIEFDGELTVGTSTELMTSNGVIDVFIGEEANVRLDAETTNGVIDIPYQLDNAVVSEEHVEGTLGTGESTLILRTSNGDINIR